MSFSPRDPNEPVSLSNLDDFKSLSLKDTDTLLNSIVTRRVTMMTFIGFLVTNALAYVAFAYIYLEDQFQLAAHLITPDQRLVTTGVILAIIAATFAQLGALVVLIGGLMFRRKTPNDS